MSYFLTHLGFSDMPSAAPADPVKWVPAGPKREYHNDVFRVSNEPILHCRSMVHWLHRIFVRDKRQGGCL
jgi:hypothetical protein